MLDPDVLQVIKAAEHVNMWSLLSSQHVPSSVEQAIKELSTALEIMHGRCERTGNMCGTDTWEVGRPCQCDPCLVWVERFSPAASTDVRYDITLKTAAQEVNEYCITHNYPVVCVAVGEDKVLVYLHDDTPADAPKEWLGWPVEIIRTQKARPL